MIESFVCEAGKSGVSGTDFNIYSTLDDALKNKNAWPANNCSNQNRDPPLCNKQAEGFPAACYNDK